MLELLAEADAPACPACGEILKPDVVFFGELLPAAAIERASQLARAAGLLLVVGSALEVYPVAGLPEETLAAGGQLAIVNKSPTPYDARAALTDRRQRGRGARAGGRGATRRAAAAAAARFVSGARARGSSARRRAAA